MKITLDDKFDGRRRVTLHDTFNGYRISSHRTFQAAVKAERKFLRGVRRANGESSYIPTEIRIDGAALTDGQREELTNIRIKLGFLRF